MSEILETAPVRLRPEETPVEVPGYLFDHHPEAKIWLGHVSTWDIVEVPDYYEGLMRFRGNVYVKELAYLGEEALDVEGREIDNDDDRSENIAAVEKVTSDDGEVSGLIIGSGRLIHKRSPSDLLPVEKHFPEVFEPNPVQPWSVEISRYISRNANRITQHTVALGLIRAMTFLTQAQGSPMAYAIVEAPMINYLKAVGVPNVTLGGPKEIDELGGVLYPISIDPLQVGQPSDGVGLPKSMQKFFAHSERDCGEGFYPYSLMKHSSEG